MGKVSVLAFVLCLLLAACGSDQSRSAGGQSSIASVAPPAPLPAPVSQPAPGQGAAPSVTPGYRFASPSMVLAPLPTGAILLVEANHDVNLQVCISFFSRIGTAEDSMRKQLNTAQLFWPIRSDADLQPPAEQSGMSAWCEQAIDPKNYDYERAGRYMKSIGRGASMGPVLLATAGADIHHDNMIIDAGKLPADKVPELTAIWTSALNKLSAAALSSEPTMLAASNRTVRHAPTKNTGVKGCKPKTVTLVDGGYTVTTSVTPERCTASDTGGASEAPVPIASKARPEPVKPTKDADWGDADAHPLTHLICTAADAAVPALAPISPYLLFAGEVFNYGYCKGVVRDYIHLFMKPKLASAG